MQDTDFIMVELDDDYPFHLKAKSKEEMKEKLWEMFTDEEGFCETLVVTIAKLKEMLKDADYTDKEIEVLIKRNLRNMGKSE